MPIADMPGYETGHFSRVYEHVFVPAIEKAGYKPVRADEVKKTNLIVADILRRIIDAEILLCDVSGRNPNVLFELGIAQAFNKRVCLIKDDKTDRIFDIQGLRDTPYEASLRIDGVKKAVAEISDALTATSKPEEHDHISLITLLGVKAATLPSTTQLGSDASILLKAIEDVGTRVAKLEKTRTRGPTPLADGLARFYDASRGLSDAQLEELRAQADAALSLPKFGTLSPDTGITADSDTGRIFAASSNKAG